MIPYGRHSIDEDDISAVVEVLRHGALTQGPKIAEFERAVADRVGARYAVAVSSGTAALHLACMAAGVGPGQRVVTSPITFVASAHCARYVGADVIFSDIDVATLNLAPAALERCLARHDRVAAIIPVHFAGLPCDMPAIHALAKSAGARVIEDAAHALGATLPDGSRVGACRHSDMTTFSFHPVKHVAAGEGGMITTNDESIYQHLLRLRSHGINKGNDPYLVPEASVTGGDANPWYYEMQELGFNYRITDIQSALALSQFRKLDRFVDRRRQLALRYDAAFAGVPQLAPVQQAGRQCSAHHLYVVRMDFDRLGTSRAAVMGRLRERGVGSQVHYIPVPAHPYYRQMGYRTADTPNAANYYAEALSLPLFFGLKDTQQDLVVETLLGAIRS